MEIQEIYQLFTQCGFNVSTDTRSIVPGSLFICLKGPNFNANKFAAQAIENGCSFALVDEEKYANGSTVFFVSDALKTLQELAKHHRKQFNIPILAITGSNAKTTHKELIHAILSKKYSALATKGNLNNHIGVPLTLLQLNSTHEIAIIEMGANHQTEIDFLCRMAEPDFGLITNIGKAHLEGFGGIEGVKKGKSEMYKVLNERGGKIFINGDDEVLQSLAKDNDKISYGCTKLYDVIGKLIPSVETVHFKWTTRYGEKDWNKLPTVSTQITGGYNFINCLAAVCVGNYFKVDDALINDALQAYVPEMNRSQVMQTTKNKLILDAYNANPTSIKAAVENFAQSNAPLKWVLLGDMFELGEYSLQEHQAIADLLSNLGFENVVLVGKEFMKITVSNFKRVETTAECKDLLIKQEIQNAVILIKGSRGMKMEELQEVL